jgi:hypothetical protein
LSRTAPADTGIAGHPAHLLRLADGRILCTYGERKPPFAICTALSLDEGRTWRPGPGVRSGPPDRDFGYPVNLQRRDGRLASIHCARDPAGAPTSS